MPSVENKYNRLLMKIGKNIKRVRLSRNLKQHQMATFGFEMRNYQRLESGKHSPSLFTLHKLALIFKVDMAEFFKDS